MIHRVHFLNLLLKRSIWCAELQKAYIVLRSVAHFYVVGFLFPIVFSSLKIHFNREDLQILDKCNDFEGKNLPNI